MKIKENDYNILKAYIQAQLLLETLDDVEDESKMNIKHITKKYKKQLEHKITQIVNNTFNSNNELFEEIITNASKQIDNIKNYFEII